MLKTDQAKYIRPDSIKNLIFSIYFPGRMTSLYRLMQLRLLFFLTGLFVNPAFGQLQKVTQLEFEKNPKFQEIMEVKPVPDGLVVMVKENSYYTSDHFKWHFKRLNYALDEVWSTSVKLESRYEDIHFYQNQDYMYWLFAEAQSENINILRLDLAQGEVDEFKGELLGKVDIHHFKVLENTAYLGGAYQEKPIVIAFPFFNKEGRILHGLYDKYLEINALEVNPLRKEINVVVKEHHKGKCGLGIKTYGANDGKLLRHIHVPGENGQSLSFITGKMLDISERESLLIGNYSNNCSDFSKGLYLTRLEEGEEMGTSIIKFSELKNFFNYMSAKRQEKIREKIEQKKKEGKEANFSYKLLIHDLIPTEKGSILVAEIYFPQQNYTNATVPLLTTRLSSEKAEDYRFTHAVVCEFDKKGRILWDNALVMDYMASKELTEQVQVSKKGDSLLLAYLDKGTLKLQVMKEGTMIGEKQDFELKSDSTQRRPDEEASVAAWYDQYYLTWGVRKIESKSPSQPEREVFYLNKLTYAVKPSSKQQ